MSAILHSVCVVLGLASLAFIAALSLRRQFADFHELVRRTPPLRRTLLALLAAAFIAYGGGKTNRGGQTGATNDVAFAGGVTNVVDGIEGNANEIASCGGAGRAALPSRVSALPSPVSCLASSAPRMAALGDEGPSSVAAADVARGWRVREVRTNSAVDYAMPEGATLASNWWVRGAYEDCSIVRLNDCSIGGRVNH